MASISFITSEVQELAQKNARKHGVSVSQYVSRLVVADSKPRALSLSTFPVEKDWGPVPKKVLERWKKEEQQAEKDYKEGKGKTYYTAEELLNDLES